MAILSLCESRSLGIHVTDMEVEEHRLLSEKLGFEVEVEEYEAEEDDYGKKLDPEASKVPSSQLVLIYSLHLAEAYVLPPVDPHSLECHLSHPYSHPYCPRFDPYSLNTPYIYIFDSIRGS
jgi:hypothetical protein